MIYLVDTIGTETGMHLYDQSFCNTLQAKGVAVRVLSNYTSADGCQKALFPNFYHGGKLLMMVKFAWALFVFALFRLSHSGTYVYQSFGLRLIDQFFIRIIGRKNLFVIVHDIFEITGTNGEDARKAQKIAFYQSHIPAIICHSENALQTLHDFGYQGRTIYYPHFSYEFSKEINPHEVAPEIKEAVKTDKINFLFFGQLRQTKGITILQKAIDILKQKDFAGNIIIAGMDKEHFIDETQQPPFVQTILRYITDSELNHLFSTCQYVLLPYTEIYQSGVLEVVIYFRCPALMSDIPYFSQMIDQFPSFGHLYHPNTPEALAELMTRIIKGNVTGGKYFVEKDIAKYNELHEPSRLISFLKAE
jgi:glycosyltransferase involved in cell wall biosynthesis